MKRHLFILLSSFAFAQAPFSKGFPNTLAVKGCAYINLLDGGFGSILGAEQGFYKNHSIGGKFIYNYFTPHGEDTKTYKGIDYTKDVDKSWIFEYKYYIPFEEYRQRTGVSFYSSLSFKTGTRTFEHDINYPHDYYYQKMNYNYLGPMIGVNILLGEYSNWSIDTQIGYLFGQKNTITNYEVPHKFVLDETYKTDIFRFEIMVAYNIDRSN